MSNITIENIAAVIKTELEPVNEKLDDHTELLKSHTQILRSHTDSFERLLTKKKTKDEEALVASERLRRLENFCQTVAKNLNIKFDL